MQMGDEGSLQVKALVPIWVECAFRHRRRLCLFAIDGRYGEGVGKA
jgi:hypothetical protein